MTQNAPEHQWNTRYDTDDYIFGTEPSSFLVSCADCFTPGMSALSIADGEGRNGVWLAEQGLDVLSMDCSERALEKARALAERRGTKLRTVCGDLTAWDWQENAFDVVLAMNFHFLPGQRSQIFRGCEQSLKAGGYLVFEGVHSDTRDHHDPHTLYDEGIVKSLCPGLYLQRLECSQKVGGKKKICALFSK